MIMMLFCHFLIKEIIKNRPTTSPKVGISDTVVYTSKMEQKATLSSMDELSEIGDYERTVFNTKFKIDG